MVSWEERVPGTEEGLREMSVGDAGTRRGRWLSVSLHGGAMTSGDIAGSSALHGARPVTFMAPSLKASSATPILRQL